MEEVEHGLADVPLLEDLATVLVDLVPLVVQHVVELESAFADVEVAAFDLDLRLRDRPGHHARLDRRRVVEAQTRHEARDVVRGKDADEIVLQRAVKARASGVTLTARTAAELVVDAPRLVPLSPDDVKPAEIGDAVAEQDVDRP